MIHRRNFLKVSAAGLATAGFSSFLGAKAFAQTANVRLAYQPGFAYGLLYVAQQKGWFEEVGVKLDPMTIFTNGSIQIDAVLANDVDLTAQGFVPLLTRAAGGQPVRIIDAYNNSGRSYAVVGKDDIDGVPKLAGRVVGINVGSNYDYFLSQVLAKYGMTAADVQLVNFADPVKAQSAFLAGQVDAIVPITTNREAILEQRKDAKVIFTAAQFSEGPNPSTTPFALYDLLSTSAAGLEKYEAAFAGIMSVVHTKIREYVTSPSTEGQAVDEIYQWQRSVIQAEVTKEQIAANLKNFQFYTVEEARNVLAGGELKSFLEGISNFLVSNKLLPSMPDIDAMIATGPAQAMKA